jgi:hypothetical protein
MPKNWKKFFLPPTMNSKKNTEFKMNNISQFPGSIEYPTLHPQAFREAKAKANNATIEVKRLFIQTQYLPSLHSRISGQDQALRTADSHLRDAVESLDTEIGLQVDTLRGLQSELRSAPEAEHEEIIEDIAQRVQTIMGIVSKQEVAIKNLIPAMADPIDRMATEKYITQLEADQARLPTEVLEIKERQTELEANRTALADAMALIEAKGFTQIAKDTALSAQEITKLGMTTPEVMAVEAAINVALQVLERAESLINYVGMIEARDRLRKQITDLIERTRAKNEELRLVTLKKDLITESHRFDDQRAQYVAEFEKCVTASRSFLSTHSNVSGADQDGVAQFAADVLSLAKHLKVMA